ncbi:MAG: hypothetical protein Pg6A_05590 [Termitinemataceae bacterium]|jgi:transcriptional regulator with XRE-family HTH domain|nr:MAG: hypothetical protein Pg6A_05590 [Termitinemataceae bacterium]
MDKEEKECRALLSLNIKRFRTRLGLSQIEFAFSLDISTTFLSDVENGKKWVSPKTLALMAKALKVEVYELFKPNDEANNDAKTVAARYIDDIEETIIRAVEESIRPTVQKSIEQMRDYYKSR